MINTFFSDLSFFTCLFFGIHENCLHRVLVFIKHVTVPKKKSPKSEWRQRVENQSITAFPLPLVFFSFSGSLLQMRVRTRISNIFKKKSPYFPAYFIRIQIPVPGSGSGSELKKRPLDRDPKKKDGDP